MLELARQPYYRWLSNAVTAAELERAYRANALFDAHRDDPGFLVDEAREAGVPMATRTAWRTGPGQRLVVGVRQGARQERQEARPAGARRPVRRGRCEGPVGHEFTADGPNQLWLGDITEHRTGEGKL